jgi:hypothetical protein
LAIKADKSASARAGRDGSARYTLLGKTKNPLLAEQVSVAEAGGVEPHPVISGTVWISSTGQRRLASTSQNFQPKMIITIRENKNNSRTGVVFSRC